MTRLARLIADRRGGVAVEMALLTPLLLMLLLGVMEFGRMAWTKAALTYAVQEAGRCATVLATCSTTGQVQAFAVQKAAALAIPAAAFTVVQNSTTPTCTWKINAQVNHGFILYRLVPTAPVIAAQVCRP